MALVHVLVHVTTTGWSADWASNAVASVLEAAVLSAWIAIGCLEVILVGASVGCAGLEHWLSPGTNWVAATADRVVVTVAIWATVG